MSVDNDNLTVSETPDPAAAHMPADEAFLARLGEGAPETPEQGGPPPPEEETPSTPASPPLDLSPMLEGLDRVAEILEQRLPAETAPEPEFADDTAELREMLKDDDPRVQKLARESLENRERLKTAEAAQFHAIAATEDDRIEREMQQFTRDFRVSAKDTQQIHRIWDQASLKDETWAFLTFEEAAARIVGRDGLEARRVRPGSTPTNGGAPSARPAARIVGEATTGGAIPRKWAPPPAKHVNDLGPGSFEASKRAALARSGTRMP